MRWISSVFLFLLVCSCAPPEESGMVQVCFSKQHNCTLFMGNFLATGQVQGCVLYDLDEPTVRSVLQEQAIPYLIDYGNADGIGMPIAGKGLMHHKFCFTNHSVVTGSLNPTQNGFYKNANHLIIIQSYLLADNYAREFRNVASYRHDSTPHNKLLFNGHLVENYFCPRDDCASHVLENLHAANTSIYFMVFSFTDQDIAQELRRKESSITVEGLLEPSQESKYSVSGMLEQAGVPVLFYQGIGKLHHKVFIIDNSTVILGSYNPTGQGNTRNRENLLILHYPEIASLFLEEYQLLRDAST